MIKDGKLINKEVRIETTNRCNAHCIMCPRDQMTRPKITMDFDIFCDVVDQCSRLGAETFSLFGYGEPLLDRDIKRKLYYCHGFDTWLTTNASLLDYKTSHDLIEAGLGNIRFSVHGSTPLEYEAVHRLNWLEVFGNIGSFLKANKNMGYPVTTHMVCIPLSGENIENIKRTWEEHVDFLEIWNPHNWGGKKNYRDVNPQRKTCNRPFTGPVQIQADGDVIPCCFLTNAEIVLGNIHNNTIEEILTGHRYNEFRKAHTSGDFGNLACGACDQRNIEETSPLIYSNRDKDRKIGVTSTTKFNL